MRFSNSGVGKWCAHIDDDSHVGIGERGRERERERENKTERERERESTLLAHFIQGICRAVMHKASFVGSLSAKSSEHGDA